MDTQDSTTTVEEEKRTHWLHCPVKPRYRGYYECHMAGDPSWKVVPKYWTGRRWQTIIFNVKKRKNVLRDSVFGLEGDKWRGSAIPFTDEHKKIAEELASAAAAVKAAKKAKMKAKKAAQKGKVKKTSRKPKLYVVQSLTEEEKAQAVPANAA